MKKLFLVGALALFGAVNAQKSGHFELGAHIGLPVGDAADYTGFNIGADAAYLWNIAQNFELGLTTGYSHYTGKDYTVAGYTVKSDGGGIVPLAATGRYNFTGGFTIGADLGYAFYTGEGADGGGFYYQPKIGYNVGQGNVYLGYKGVSEDGYNLNSINLGYVYKF